jgi:hypothetical protein
MTDNISIMNFPTVEAAARWAQLNKPFKRAMENFQNRDLYRKLYGHEAYKHAMTCWELANKGGHTEEFIKEMRKLSWSLPKWVWDYENHGGRK